VSGSVGRGDTYMLSGCELIDIDMKFGGEWAKRTSHKLHGVR
jgi:hypothetical protein